MTQGGFFDDIPAPPSPKSPCVVCREPTRFTAVINGAPRVACCGEQDCIDELKKAPPP